MVEQNNGGSQPMTTKQRIQGIVFAVILAALGVSMFIWPDALAGDDDGPSGRRSRWIFTVLRWVWSTPGGVVAVLLGLLIMVGSLKKSAALQR